MLVKYPNDKQFLIVLFLLIPLSYIIQHTIWKNYLILTHAAMELFCIFIAFSIFILNWFFYDKTSPTMQLLGYGYIVISFLNFLHLLNYQNQQYSEYNYSILFSLVSRLLEGIVLLSISAGFSIKINKRSGLLGTIIICSAITVITYINKTNSPIFNTPEGFTIIKYAWEMAIFMILLISFYLMRKKKDYRDMVAYKNIFMALGIAVLAAVIILMQKRQADLNSIIGHLLRSYSYYHLFISVVISTIAYPYQRLEEILNHLPLGITTYDRNYRRVFSNIKCEEITGYKNCEVQGLTDREIIAKFYEKNSREHIIRQLADKSSILKRTFRIITKSGENVKIIADAYRLQSGGYLCIYDTAKRAQALENLQLQTKTILNSLHNFAIISDSKSQIVHINKAALDILEAESEELMGLNINEFAAKIQFSRLDLIEAAQRGGLEPNTPFEATIENTNGQKKELLLELGIIKDIEGEIIGGVAIGSDITEMKREQEEGLQKEKLALLGQMATGIVHEIRNPLTAMSGFTQLIRMRTREDYTSRYCSHTEKEIAGLNKIVSDFLQFARPKPAIFQIKSLNSLVKSMSLLLDTEAFQRSIKIIYHLRDEIPVRIDEDKIRQVILNIVKNAFDVLKEHQDPQVMIRTEYNPLFNEMYLSIQNNARALTAEERAKIGTPFFTTKTKGTGLGISICKQIIAEHEGRLNVRSEEGTWTVFEIALKAYVITESQLVHNL